MHTPGPWAVDEDEGWVEVIGPVIVSASGRQVAVADWNHQDHAEQASIDARLIAAAPELLALVEKWLETGIRRYEAFAVIAKARGESESAPSRSRGRESL